MTTRPTTPATTRATTRAATEPSALLTLVDVMARLRGECAWKAAQTHRTLARHLLEETYEAVEAIETGDAAHLREELGDVLLQVYFHASIAAEAGEYDVEDVATGLIEKLIRRNPHVFGDPGQQESDPATINETWERLKAQEKQRGDVLEGIPLDLPALARATKVLERRARDGDPVTLVPPGGDPGIGERLLAIVEQARRDGVDPEQELRRAVREALRRGPGADRAATVAASPAGAPPGLADPLAVNRAYWDERVAPHVASPDYSVERLVSGPQELSDVVRFDEARLGDLAGVRAVHLQCHIGTDTVSLARLGAHVTGLDFSAPAIEAARDLAARCGVSADFVHAEVDHAPEALGGERVDLVYTGVGALCWLPSIERWAEIVSRLLVPGGRLFLREAHPMLWAGTYVATDHVVAHNATVACAHGLGEIVSALLRHGLRIVDLVEHDSVPWEALPGQMVQDGPYAEWRLREHRNQLPLTYTLQAVREG